MPRLDVMTQWRKRLVEYDLLKRPVQKNRLKEMRRTSDHTPRSQCKRYHPKTQPRIIIGQILLKTRLNNQYSIFIGRQTHSPSTTTPTFSYCIQSEMR